MENIHFETIYTYSRRGLKSIADILKPNMRMLLRFLALPYCFAYQINWKECKKSKIKVFFDLLYIFFFLKYYPYNYSPCRLYEKNRKGWHLYYGSIYDPYQKMKLSKEVQREEYKIIFNDKEVCYQLCDYFRFPLPPQYGILDPKSNYTKSLIDIYESNLPSTLIIKPILGSGGKGILISYKDENSIKIRDKNQIIRLEDFKLYQRSVVQELLLPHPKISFGFKCFNTVRIVTLLTKSNEVLILGSFLRIGLGSSYVDNISSGGIKVSINIKNGHLNNRAHDSNCRVYDKIPDRDIDFSGFEIPFWEDVIKLSKKIQSRFSYYKLLGIDIGITSDGPVLIEINPSHDNIGLEQATGPLLANQKIKNAFKEYNLIL
jgi:hypothetical protein